MKVLVAWGSERGGTEGIAREIADVLASNAHDVTAVAAEAAPPPDGFDAVVLGGALYAGRWHRRARRYARHHAEALKRTRVWFFSSGPLDTSADASALPPVPRVDALMRRIGVVEHVTFGGRLQAFTTGFIARAMAKQHAGDWRNYDRVRAWAQTIAHSLARPPGARTAAEQPRVIEP